MMAPLRRPGWERLNKSLVERRRKDANREKSPSLGVIDSQSVKCSEWGVVPKGFDGNKKVNGRKRHIVVDTLGLVLVVVVHAANQHDSPAARLVLTALARQGYDRMSKILADSAYGKELARWVKTSLGYILEVVKVSELGGFQPGRRCGGAHALEGGTNFCLDELVSAA